MKKQFSCVLIPGLVLTLFGCDDKTTTVVPAPAPANLTEVYLPVGFITAGGYDLTSLRKFNKTSYSDLDSVVFTGIVRSDEEAAYRIVELVNVSENQVVASVAADASGSTHTLTQPGNILDELPAREVTLGVRIRTAKGIEYHSGSHFYLYLYRKGVTPVGLGR